MTNLIIPPRHYFMTINQDAAEICQPLFQGSPIKSFCYVRFYKDKSSYGILTSKEWLIHHMTMQYDLGPPKHLVSFHKNKCFCLITENEFSSLNMLKSYQEVLNIAYPFYLFPAYRTTGEAIQSVIRFIDRTTLNGIPIVQS